MQDWLNWNSRNRRRCFRLFFGCTEKNLFDKIIRWTNYPCNKNYYYYYYFLYYLYFYYYYYFQLPLSLYFFFLWTQLIQIKRKEKHHSLMCRFGYLVYRIGFHSRKINYQLYNYYHLSSGHKNNFIFYSL